MWNKGKAFCMICGDRLAGELPVNATLMLTLEKRVRGTNKIQRTVPGISYIAHEKCSFNVVRFVKFLEKQKSTPNDAILEFLKAYAPQGELVKRVEELMEGKTLKAADNMGQEIVH